jgi:hypothetical protein
MTKCSSAKPTTPCGCIRRAWLGKRVVGSGTRSNPASRIAVAVVVPTVCAVSRPFREPGKARRIWAAASCGVPCKRTEIPGGVCCASRRESRRLAMLPPPTRCITVSAVISSGLPIGTLDLVVLGEWPLSCPFYRVGTKKTTPVYQTLMLWQPNNGLSGLFSWINAYRRQFFLLNLSTRGLYRRFSRL